MQEIEIKRSLFDDRAREAIKVLTNGISSDIFDGKYVKLKTEFHASTRHKKYHQMLARLFLGICSCNKHTVFLAFVQPLLHKHHQIVPAFEPCEPVFLFQF